ncbi:MAG: FAD-binding oxidoreductase [Chitinophagaceae bacterium]|nr:FAD-binding oxidoreductase [Chitinophagaceae bacterium]
MSVLSLAEELLQLLPAECVKTKLADRVSYASDAGFYQLVPQAVVLPRHEADIIALLALSHRLQLPLVFRAGGTSLSGQSITDGILVDVSRHWRQIKVDAGASCVTVAPGLTGGLVNHYLKKHALKIGPDPASINAAMMGGIHFARRAAVRYRPARRLCPLFAAAASAVPHPAQLPAGLA